MFWQPVILTFCNTTFIEVVDIFLSAKKLVKKIVFRKNFLIFHFDLCSRLKKVLYGFFN